MNLIVLILGFLITFSTHSFAQKDFYSSQFEFTEKDSLRGQLSPARTCFDVKHYTLDIQLDIEQKHIQGYVDMTFEATDNFLTLQVDLFSNMQLDKVVRLDNQQELKTKRNYNAIFINMGERIAKGTRNTIRMYYSGQPHEAIMPPWNGGLVFEKDDKGRDFVTVACEGIGASLWWPNKDHLSDEPEEGMDIKVAVPKGLQCVANGQFIGSEDLGNGYERFDWRVSYPINNYNVTLNVAHYSHFKDVYKNKAGRTLDLDYYVLDYNLNKAKVHFQQVHQVLEAFEHYFGFYPFPNDGYALVETSYLGMEHQGAIAYGNQYLRGYLGGQIPSDMDFDYIIVHETGHEYFGNSISCNDHAEMWIHESFTTYMETLFVEYTRGYDDAVRYINNQRAEIGNAQPIIGPLDVNFNNWSYSDQYYKGAWMLHTLRHALQNDTLWFEILKGFHVKYKRKNIDSKAFFDWVNEKTGKDYTPFFQQYLYYPNVPVLEYKLEKIKGKKYTLKYRWITDVTGFDMPIRVKMNGKKRDKVLYPTNQWKSQKICLKNGASSFRIRADLFLIELMHTTKP